MDCSLSLWTEMCSTVLRHWDSLESEEEELRRRRSKEREKTPSYLHMMSPSPRLSQHRSFLPYLQSPLSPLSSISPLPRSSPSSLPSPLPSPFFSPILPHQLIWLNELRLAMEHECMSILYAKSLLDESPKLRKDVRRGNRGEGESWVEDEEDGEINEERQERGMGDRRRSRPLSISIGMRFDVSDPMIEGPPKPRRCIARMLSSRAGRTVSTASTPFVPSSSHFTPSSSLPYDSSSSSVHSSPLSTRTLDRPMTRRVPPSYEDVSNRERLARLTHSISVNVDEREEAKRGREGMERRHNLDRGESREEGKSMETLSTASVDSGQCSGEPVFSSQQSFSSEKGTSSDSFPLYHNRLLLPSYVRMASTMDHVLRTASSIYALLSRPNSSSVLSSKVSVFLQMLQSSPLSSFLSPQEQRAVREAITCNPISDYGRVIIRKEVENAMLFFTRIICQYLSECSNKDRLLPIAIEHLVHVCLFGDELCIHAIDLSCLDRSLKLVQLPCTPPSTRRLLIRLLAVLCGTSKGCLQLLALGGLPTVLSSLSSPSSCVSIEAAGLLTQLTNPSCNYLHIDNIEPLVTRLLEMVDSASTSEFLLLSSAALANISHQNVPILYQKNAVLRLINAYRRRDCSSIFVQEQLVTIFSRLAARKYEECLIAHGAVPILLELMTSTDSQHPEYCRRIRYKAAVCVGTLAATGVGLKALYANHAYAIVCHVLDMDNSPSSTLNMICSNIKNKLETKYKVESAV